MTLWAGHCWPLTFAWPASALISVKRSAVFVIQIHCRWSGTSRDQSRSTRPPELVTFLHTLPAGSGYGTVDNSKLIEAQKIAVINTRLAKKHNLRKRASGAFISPFIEIGGWKFSISDNLTQQYNKIQHIFRMCNYYAGNCCSVQWPGIFSDSVQVERHV